MRNIMQNKTELNERMAYDMSNRQKNSEQLFEKWNKVKSLNENGSMDRLYETNPKKAQNLAIILENQWNWMKKLTETQISSAFTTTPENVMRIVRLGYPNSVRGDIFLDWPMETARDSIYYLKPKYTASKRGATSGSVPYESPAYRYASEINEDIIGAGDVSTATFPFNLPIYPIRPFTVKVMVDQKYVGTDNGANVITGATISTGSIDYTTGVGSVTFSAGNYPAAGAVVTIESAYDSEVSGNYPQIQNVELTLTDFQFRAKPWPLYISWSKMTELLLGTTLDIDAEEALLRGAAEELKKSLDFHACRVGYRYALGNSFVTFNADFAAAGADSEMAHAQSITRKIADAGAVIYAALQRGGVSKMVAGYSAANYIKLHMRFKGDESQPKIGIYKIGSLDGVDIFQAPSAIVPSNEIMCIWKNENEQTDSFVAFGTLIPLYQTQTLEFKESYKETGLYHFGDWRALQPQYGVRLVLSNLT
jgi:hypothetical protein